MLSTIARRTATAAVRTTPKVNLFSRYSYGTYKESTGLVGLAVDPNGRENLQKISAEILSSVQVRRNY